MEKNIEPKNLKKISGKDKIKKLKYNTKVGTHFLIIPEKTQKLREKNRPVSEIKLYWDGDDIDDIIKQNFKFDKNAKYNIYVLSDGGWVGITKRTYTGQQYNVHIPKILIYGDTNNGLAVEDEIQHIYAIEIEQIV